MSDTRILAGGIKVQDNSVPTSSQIIGKGLAATIGSSNIERALSGAVTNPIYPAENVYNWLNWFLGSPFKLDYNVASAGATVDQSIDVQFPQLAVINPRPEYAFVVAGINDIFSAGDGTVVAGKVVRLIELIMGLGITPIWGTLTPRYATSSIQLIQLMVCNKLLLKYAEGNPCGYFIDFFSFTGVPNAASPQMNVSYIQTDNIHTKNLGGFYIGQQAAHMLENAFIWQKSNNWGNDYSYHSLNQLNTLRNCGYAVTTGGTLTGLGLTGVMPSSFTAQWTTRVGAGSADFSLVNLLDVDGSVRGVALKCIITGLAVDGDVLKISAPSGTLRPELATYVVGEVCLSATGLGFVKELGLNITTLNGNTSQAGYNSYPAEAAALPATIPAIKMVTPKVYNGDTQTAAGELSLRVVCNGAATGTILIWGVNFRTVDLIG
jgi:hypothetical protein